MRALIAFDLDGVIYSSEPFLGEAYREAIANVNAQRPGSFRRVPATREILDHVGWPVPVILARLFPGLDRDAIALLSREALGVICAHVARREGVVFPGVAETLATLTRAGFTLAIASNGRRPYIEAVLDAHDLRRHFTDLVSVGGELTDKAGVLRAYLRTHAIGRAALIMVGDRASDVEAAAAVGAWFLGCDYGHGHRAEIEGAGLVVSAFDQLPPVVEAILKTASQEGR
jgi:phosphoglycolate phosphatase